MFKISTCAWLFLVILCHSTPPVHGDITHQSTRTSVYGGISGFIDNNEPTKISAEGASSPRVLYEYDVISDNRSFDFSSVVGRAEGGSTEKTVVTAAADVSRIRPNKAPKSIINSPSGNVTINTGATVSFAGTGSDPDGNLPLSYLWHFGSGSGVPDSTLEDPGAVQFNTAGTYTVTFTVTDALGLSDPTPASRVITVQSAPGNQPPDGVINLPAGNVTINTGATVNFTGTGSDPDGNLPLSYLWRFGSGSGVPDLTLEDPGAVQFNTAGTYTVTFTVTDALGLSDPTPASRVITAQSALSIIPKTNWRLVYVDSEELVGENGAATNSFDGQPATIWHTQWLTSNPPPPHEIQIDLGQTYTMNGFRYLPRQDGGVNGRIKQYEFYVSSDGQNWSTPVATGTFVNDATEKEVVFAAKSGRFIRLRALSEVNGNPWTTMAEITVLGGASGNQPPDGVMDTLSGDITIYSGERVVLAGTGSDPDGNVPLSYLWRFGNGSGVPDSTLEDPGVVQFNTAGSYTVTFTVTDALGLSDPTPVTRFITVNSTPFEMIPDLLSTKSSSFAPFSLYNPSSVNNPVLTKYSVSDVPAAFVADPFMFHENGTWYLFFEVDDYIAKKGKIGLATSSDGLHWVYGQIVLNETFHLSYPYVFKYNGKYYMIPETYMMNEVRVYESTNFPYNWQYLATMVKGRDYVDPSIIRYNGLWWMFVSDTSCFNCYLFYSDNLLGGWTEHPMSPIVMGDQSKARPGGRSFVYSDGRIFRIAQKDDLSYGEKVRAFQVDILNKTRYAEHEIPESPILDKSGTGWNASGMHHYDPWWDGNQWLCSVDGVQTNGTWAIGIYSALSPSSPSGVIDSPARDVMIDVGDTVTFAGTGTDPGGNLPLRYLWHFGDGSGIPDSSLEDPGILQLTVPGTYTVTFTVTNSLDLSDPTPATRVITVKSASTVIPKTNWRLMYVDSEELVGENGVATNSFDGQPATIWHTQWLTSNPPPPHEIQIDLGQTYTMNGFRYLPRQDGGVNGRIKQYEFYVSSDGQNWSTPVATGTFVNDATEKEVVFAAKSGRFIRLRALSEVNGNPWTTMAEISVLAK